MPATSDMVKLNTAVQANDLNAILALFEQADFDVNTRGRCDWTPLLVAVEENRPDLVRLFLCMGANPNQRLGGGPLFTPLARAAEKGFEEVVSVLLNDYRTKVTPLENQSHPLREAAAGGHINIVRLLLDKGINPNIRGKKPASALAAENGHEELAELLASRESDSLEQLILEKIRTQPQFEYLSKPEALASVALSSRTGFFPRHLASKVQDKHGAQEFPLTGYFDTQAFNACLDPKPTDNLDDNSAKLLRLFENGLVYYDGYLGYGRRMLTLPIFDAAKRGLEGVARILLACGTEISEKNIDDLTAVEVARAEGHLSIAALLEGAKQRQIDIFKEYKTACDAGTVFDFSKYENDSTVDSADSNDSSAAAAAAGADDGGAAGAAAAGAGGGAGSGVLRRY